MSKKDVELPPQLPPLVAIERMIAQRGVEAVVKELLEQWGAEVVDQIGEALIVEGQRSMEDAREIGRLSRRYGKGTA